MLQTIHNTTNNHEHWTVKNYDVVYTLFVFLCTSQKTMINPLQSYFQALLLNNSKNWMVMLGSIRVGLKDVATWPRHGSPELVWTTVTLYSSWYCSTVTQLQCNCTLKAKWPSIALTSNLIKTWLCHTIAMSPFIYISYILIHLARSKLTPVWNFVF